jgi:hypothetical protein
MSFRNSIMARTVPTIMLGALLVFAQYRKPGKPMRMYDPATETKVTGIVEDVTQQTQLPFQSRL